MREIGTLHIEIYRTHQDKKESKSKYACRYDHVDMKMKMNMNMNLDMKSNMKMSGMFEEQGLTGTCVHASCRKFFCTGRLYNILCAVQSKSSLAKKVEKSVIGNHTVCYVTCC